MTPVPAPSLGLPQEDWADTDFDLPDGDALNTHSDAESDNEDWDVEMNLGRTGGGKASLSTSSPLASTASTSPGMITVRPPINIPSGEQADDEDDYEDDGASTIKVTHMPPIPPRTLPPPTDEDIENAFELPSDLSQLSLRPLTLHHRSSKTSLEWGDRDHTSSSTSSDAYSTLGFGPSASPSSNSTSAPSAGELETDEEDDEEGELDGLVLPTGLFESGHGGKQLSKILEAKKRLPVVDERAKVASPDSEDDFEVGLVIDDDFDLSPSRLPSNRLQSVPGSKKTVSRSKSVPPRPPVGPVRPPSRLTGTIGRSKSPNTLISTSTRSIRPTILSPPLLSSRLTATRISTLSSAPPSSHNNTFLQSPSSGPLRAQKSHSVLKPPSPRGATSSHGPLSRKASLSSLIDTSTAGPSSSSIQTPTTLSSYNAPTAASRARTQQQPQTQFNPHSTTRLRAPDPDNHFAVPPTRPCTPSSNPAAIRLTMPTSSSRAKARPAISSVFGQTVSVKERDRAPSPVPPRPSSTSSNKASSSKHSAQNQPRVSSTVKVLRRPKRARTYGDGTELDGIEDLPTDRDKERRFRVIPKGVGAPRISKGAPEQDTKSTIGRKAGRREGSDTKVHLSAPAPNTLRRKERIDFSSKVVGNQPQNKQKKSLPRTPSNLPGGTTRRKPTLIRNLGGAGSPKVVGDMKWNPQTLRWEGNDQALRDFDAATASSTRPALITHLTGSSIGSPVTTFASGARVVGNMIFDPARMCWISRLPPEEDEPDVFADLADDEDEWESRGGTIRAAQGQTAPLDESVSTTAATRGGDTPSPGRPGSSAHSHTRTMSESGSERGARPALTSLLDIDGKLLEKCRAAEDRHRAEMKGWRVRVEKDEPDRAALYEIRALATRQY